MAAHAVEIVAPAAVLRVQAVGDADLVAVLFCPQRGRIDAFGRGVRSSRKRFAGGALQPFNVIEARLQAARNGGMPTVASATVRMALLGPSPTYAQLVAGSYLLEMAGQLCQPGHGDAALYRWLVVWAGACGRLPDQAMPAVVAAAELGALWVAGVLPQLDRCARCGDPIQTAGATWPAGGDGLGCRACSPPGAPWVAGADLQAIDASVRGFDPDRVARVTPAAWTLVSERARAHLHHALRGPLRTGQAVADTLRSATSAPTLAAPLAPPAHSR